jgi:peptidyl-prolyl cis-trans isomerase SurA
MSATMTCRALHAIVDSGLARGEGLWQNEGMKSFLFYFGICFLLVSGAAAQQRLPAGGVMLDSYAAVVNGKVITVGEILAALQPIQAELMTKYEGEQLEQALFQEFERIRDILVDSELVLMEFATQGGQLPDRAVEDHVQSIITERFNNDRTAFMEALAEERLTIDQWRERMKNQLVVQLMRQRQVASKVVISPADILAEYNANVADFSTPERVRLRMIVIKKGETSREQEERFTKAIRIRDRLDRGFGPFGRAAKLLSEAANAGNEGAVGWLEVDSLAPELEKAIREVGETGIAPVVTLGDEYFIVQVEDRSSRSVQPLAEVYEMIERRLRAKEIERLAQIWLSSLRAKYYVQVFKHDPFQ